MAASIDDTSDSQTLLSSSRNSWEKRPGKDLDDFNYPARKRKGRSFASITLPVIVHLILISLYTASFFAYWDHKEAKYSAIVQRHKTGLHAYSATTPASCTAISVY